MSAEAATAVPELQVVNGPSAFGEDGRKRFFEILWIVSVTEFRLNYANTALGFLWTIVKPLVFFGVVFIVLRGILRVGANVENYGLILVLGLVMFQFFQEVTSRSVRSMPGREGLIRKVRFPRIIVPLSISLTASLTLLLNVLAVLPIFIGYGVIPTPEWLLFIPILLTLVAYSTAVGLILSVMFLRFPDIDQIWGLVSRVLFYASPVLFPIELVPQPFDKIMSLNPLAPLIELARIAVIDPSAPGPVQVAGWVAGILIPFGIIGFLCVYSVRLFVREAPLVAEAL